MATKTISLAKDAYERLKAEKRAGESFSDVVRRLTTGVKFTDFHGSLSEETVEALEEAIAGRRDRHAAERADRRARLRDFLDDS